jgi:hypothetical protein
MVLKKIGFENMKWMAQALDHMQWGNSVSVALNIWVLPQEV